MEYNFEWTLKPNRVGATISKDSLMSLTVTGENKNRRINLTIYETLIDKLNLENGTEVKVGFDKANKKIAIMFHNGGWRIQKTEKTKRKYKATIATVPIGMYIRGRLVFDIFNCQVEGNVLIIDAPIR